MVGSQQIGDAQLDEVQRDAAEFRVTCGKPWDASLLRVHAQLDPTSISAVLANELGRLSASDRVTVLGWRGGRLRVAAISGVAHFDSRSPVVLALEALAAGVAQEGQAVWYSDGVADDQPGGEWLAEYVDCHPVRALVAMPVGRIPGSRSAGEGLPAGVVVCERFDQRPYAAGERQVLAELGRHAAVALERACEMNRLPLLRWALRLKTWGRGQELRRGRTARRRPWCWRF